jgi:hypothetical protein
MSLCGAYAIFMEIFSGTAISAQTRTPGGYCGRSVQKAMCWDTECYRASEQKLMAFRELRDSGSAESYKAYIDCETNLRNIGKQKKAEAWQDTAPFSHIKTRLSDIWKMARRFWNPRSQISMLGSQRLHPKLLPMNFRSHIWPLKGSYGLRSH